MSPERRVETIFRRIDREESSKGRRNEFKAVAAFEYRDRAVPEWFIGIRNASDREERAGIDVMVEADGVPKIRIQIKSCQKKADGFRADQEKGRYRRDIEVIVIREDFSQGDIREVVIAAATRDYHRQLRARAEKCGVTFIAAAA